jgi:hypothetical protein
VEIGDVVNERGDNELFRERSKDSTTAEAARHEAEQFRRLAEETRELVLIVATRSKPFDRNGRRRETAESARIASEEARRLRDGAHGERGRTSPHRPLLGTPWSMPSARQLMR